MKRPLRGATGHRLHQLHDDTKNRHGRLWLSLRGLQGTGYGNPRFGPGVVVSNARVVGADQPELLDQVERLRGQP